MPNPVMVDLIASHLARGLTHPGDGDQQPAKQIPLPGLSATGMPDQQAKYFAEQAGMPANDVPRLIAEAVIALIEGEGQSTIVGQAELEQLRTQAATLEDAPPTATVSVHCTCNRSTPLLEVPIGRPKVTTSGRLLLKGIAAVCTCQQ